MGDDGALGTVAIGRVRYAQAADSGGHAPGTGRMARYLAVGSGVDSVSYYLGFTQNLEKAKGQGKLA